MLFRSPSRGLGRRQPRRVRAPRRQPARDRVNPVDLTKALPATSRRSCPGVSPHSRSCPLHARSVRCRVPETGPLRLSGLVKVRPVMRAVTRWRGRFGRVLPPLGRPVLLVLAAVPGDGAPAAAGPVRQGVGIGDCGVEFGDLVVLGGGTGVLEIGAVADQDQLLSGRVGGGDGGFLGELPASAGLPESPHHRGLPGPTASWDRCRSASLRRLLSAPATSSRATLRELEQVRVGNTGALAQAASLLLMAKSRRNKPENAAATSSPPRRPSPRSPAYWHPAAGCEIHTRTGRR